MTSKVNVLGIVKGHYATLSDPKGKLLRADYLLFLGLPVLLAIFASLIGLHLGGGQISLLVNFGAIFTALLLSVLVLVYEQENKAHAAKANNPTVIDVMFDVRLALLRELYLNISYSIIVALLLIFFCFLASFAVDLPSGKSPLVVWFFTPVIIFLISNLMLTIVMVVKRLHALLITR